MTTAEALVIEYAKVMSEIDAVNRKKPFDAFAAGKLASRHETVLKRMREEGEFLGKEESR